MTMKSHGDLLSTLEWGMRFEKGKKEKKAHYPLSKAPYLIIST